MLLRHQRKSRRPEKAGDSGCLLFQRKECRENEDRSLSSKAEGTATNLKSQASSTQRRCSSTLHHPEPQHTRQNPYADRRRPLRRGWAVQTVQQNSRFEIVRLADPTR